MLQAFGSAAWSEPCVRGKRVLLKPNLVEFDPNTCINTNVAVIAAAYEAFSILWARRRC